MSCTSRKNNILQQLLRSNHLEGSFAWKNLGVPVGKGVTVSQQCVLTIKRVVSKWKGSDGSSYCVQFWAPQFEGGEEDPPSWVTKMMKGLQHHLAEERLSKLGLFSLEKRRLRRVWGGNLKREPGSSCQCPLTGEAGVGAESSASTQENTLLWMRVV